MNNDELNQLLKSVMRHCKLERKRHRAISNSDLAKRLGVTIGYVSALENGRAKPSIETFFRYLLTNGFEIEPILNLKVKKGREPGERARLRALLSERAASLDEHQLYFLIEQSRIAEELRIKLRKTL